MCKPLFYGSWSLSYLPLLIGIAAISWGLGVWMDQQRVGQTISTLQMLCSIIVFVRSPLSVQVLGLAWMEHYEIGTMGGADSMFPNLTGFFPLEFHSLPFKR